MIDFATPEGKVRLKISDLDEENPVFTDQVIAGYLDLNDGNVSYASADALEAIALSELLLAKKIRTQDLSTDGPAVAKELRELAKRIRDNEDLFLNAGQFEYIPFGGHQTFEGEESRH